MLAILFKLLVGISVLDLSQQVYFEIHYRCVMKYIGRVALDLRTEQPVITYTILNRCGLSLKITVI